MQNKKNVIKMFKAALATLVSAAGLTYIFYNVPLAEVFGHWTSQSYPWIAVIFVCTFFSMTIQAKRWRGLLLEDGRNVPFKTFYGYIAMGYFFNNILPSGFGGDAVKTIAFGRRFGHTENSVAAVAISRVMGLIAMFICFFIALPFVARNYEIPLQYTLIVCAMAVISVFIIVGGLFSDKIKIPTIITNKIPFLCKLQQAFSIYRNHKIPFLMSGVDSIWLQLSSIIIHFAYFKAVGVSIDLATITVFMTISLSVTMLPISINGIGLRESLNVSLFTGLLGISPDKVLAATLIWYIPMLFQVAQGAIAFAIMRKDK
ncbi:MAG: flippase-like domain-containing protein [Fibrobacter sp.]|nr:flippase-like domain-containing protein [Fibrobacter sp.]